MTGSLRTNGAMTGRCLCGAVTIRLDGDHVAGVGICHCRMCLRWNGTAFGCFAADPGAVTVTGDVTRHASSDFAERAFCPACGSHLWMRDTTSPGEDYELMPGLFADAADFSLISEIYTDRAPAYAAFAGAPKRATGAEYEARNRHVPEDPE